MFHKLDTPVSVSWVFDHQHRRVLIKSLLWERKVYPVIKIGLHHTYRTGKTLYHVFSVESPTLFFRLVFNTENLHWRLEEMADGEPN